MKQEVYALLYIYFFFYKEINQLLQSILEYETNDTILNSPIIYMFDNDQLITRKKNNKIFEQNVLLVIIFTMTSISFFVNVINILFFFLKITRILNKWKTYF